MRSTFHLKDGHLKDGLRRHIAVGGAGLANILAALLALIGGVLLAASASATPLRYQATFKAKFPAASEYRTIGVMNFEGEDAENFTGALLAALQSVTIKGAPYFTVKTGLAAAAPGRDPEIAAAVAYGRLIGAEVVYAGHITSGSVHTTPRQETRQTCVVSGPKLFSPCQQYQNFAVSCAKVDATYTVTPRAIRVADGAVVYSQTITFSSGYDHCDDQNSGQITLASIFGGKPKNDTAAPQTPDSLLQSLRDQAVARVRSDVAPSDGFISVDFKEKAPELAKEFQDKFKSGVEFAKGNRADRACGIWDSMNDGAAAQSPTLLYNLGACSEILEPDNPRAALGFYTKADSLLTKPDPAISAALQRMQTAGTNR